MLSAGYFLAMGQIINVLICLGTLLLVTLPLLAQHFLGLGLCRSFFIFCVLYAMGPMLGKAFKLYYLTSWWDKLLHTCGGVAFAAVGACLASGVNGGQQTSLVMRAVFGLCFSIAVAAVWEFFEYGVDYFFAADMQNDTVVSAIHSHYLSAAAGGMRSISGIEEVTLNGVPLGIGGYLDIGLIDTMRDMLVETAGAVLYTVWYLFDRDRNPQLYRIKA